MVAFCESPVPSYQGCIHIVVAVQAASNKLVSLHVYPHLPPPQQIQSPPCYPYPPSPPFPPSVRTRSSSPPAYAATYCSLQQYCRMLGESRVYEMRGSQFPFGVFTAEEDGPRKIFVKKRYCFKNDEEFEELMEKVSQLKGVSHRNTINLRAIEEKDDHIDMLYQYVPLSLEEAFSEQPSQAVKEIHRQFIQLAIYLAKHCILTAFNPSRCGAVTSEERTVIKYYLPLHEIKITSNRASLERAVQLFNVQSMHYLDTLVTQALNSSTVNESSSQRTFKNRVKLYPSLHHKDRKDSQPAGGLHQASPRKLSGRPSKESQFRKLSTLSRELSEISEYHKRRGASTRVSGESINTFQSILSLNRRLDTNPEKQHKENTLSSSQQTLKRCLSQNIISPTPQIHSLIARSRKALDSLQHLRAKMSSYKGFVTTIIQLKKEDY